MNKTVLVTGSSVGLGRETIRLFAKLGYNVVINYNNSQKETYELENEIKKMYDVDTLVVKCDISDEESVKNMVDIIKQHFNRVDVLVNNAAIEISSSLEEKTKHSFDEILKVNVIGTFLVSKYIGMDMFLQKRGKIINISSNNAIDKYDPSTLEYDASKSAIINMTNNFAKEFSPYVNVNCIAPGWIKTEKIIKLDNELDNKFISSQSDEILLNRFADPIEVAKVIAFLASDDANYINSTVIKVDGGSK